MKKEDLNNLSDFSNWVDKTFNWLEPRAKGLMRRAWCARGKYDRKRVMPRKSLCCNAEMTEGGQCLCCGANGYIDKEVHSMEILTREEHKKRHEKLLNI